MNTDTVFGAAAATSPQVRPFAVVKWGNETPFIGRVGSSTLELWVYDEGSSYSRINDIISRAITVLCEDNVDIAGADGSRFSTARWGGTSPELYDDIYKCVVRFATFTVI
jgi:hypothetical protein